MSDESTPKRSRDTYVPKGNVGLFFGPDDDMSLADQVAQMAEEERERVLDGVDMDDLEWDSDFWLRPSQIALANSTAPMTVALAGRGWGKALDLLTPLPTPTGWTTMGEVQPGDMLLGADGYPTQVVAKTPTWIGTDTYSVTFSDHTTITASAEHLWAVVDNKNRNLTLTTAQIADTHIRSSRGDARYKIPMPKPLELKPLDLQMDPYALGAWLGDGDTARGYITSIDPEIVDAYTTLGYTVYPRGRARWSIHGLTADLRSTGVLNNKHIPQRYLRASLDQRTALLQGLMDTDGYIDPKTGKCEFTTTNSKIRDGISELLSTLALKHSVNENRATLDGRDCGPKWRVIFHAKADTPVFRLPRKRDRQPERTGTRELSTNRRIIRVEKVATVPTACIQVDSPDHLFLAGKKMVPTHNSHVLSIAMHNYAMSHPGARLLLVGRTTSDVRDVMILGDSGIMNTVNPAERPKYNPAVRKLTWANGTIALCYSAERPDSMRGIQAHASFCDEVAAYRSNAGAGLANAFDQVQLLTRLTYKRTLPDGTYTEETPQIFVATTPKRVPMILDLVKQAEEDPSKVLLVRGPTRANKALSNAYKERIEGMFAGTALGKQELEGELLTDVEGSLLNQGTLDAGRYELGEEDDPDFWRLLPNRVIGVDPSVSSAPKDECGIVVVAATGDRKLYKRTAYVLEDASLLGPPQQWAKEVVRLARKYRAVVVAEKNQGGEMVRMVIQHEDPFVPVVLVHAAVSKEERAEPVGTAYERGAVRHVGWHPELESQLTSWAPGVGLASPDRLDAVVHAVTSVLIAPPKELVGKAKVIGNPSDSNLDVKDHNPAMRYPEDGFLRTNGFLDEKVDEAPADDKQLIFARVQRPRQLAIGQRDIGLGGSGAYTTPNRFRRRT